MLKFLNEFLIDFFFVCFLTLLSQHFEKYTHFSASASFGLSSVINNFQIGGVRGKIRFGFFIYL